VQAANFPGLILKPGSMGIACPLYDLNIIDESGNVLPDGKEGHIAIRLSPTRPFAMFSEYANDPERNAEAFRTGWYYTGDTGYRDQDGYFWYVGRADDVIKSSGYRIGPFEIESALIRHPAVAESAAVASPDPLRGAIVKCYVVLKQGQTGSPELAQELSAFVARETAPYKHPRKIEFVDSLDEFKTVSGKIRRRDLKLNEYKAEGKKSLGSEFAVKPMSGA
jgi:acyl-coenzyme A synthetase/AMP-(fatty) acid ligase